MPKVWFPDIEPEASNTIMASSLAGRGLVFRCMRHGGAACQEQTEGSGGATNLGKVRAHN
jgi:hypothetical protein